MTTRISNAQDVVQMIYSNGQNHPPTIRFHEDGGHGWLQVPKPLIVELQLEGKVSAYSFHDDHNLYLEEDCDLSTFFQAIGIGFSQDEPSETRSLRKLFWENCPRDYCDNSPVRNYYRWKGTKESAEVFLTNKFEL